MRNTTIRTVLFFVASALLLIAVMVSCASLNSSLSTISAIERISAPVDAFVVVHVTQSLLPTQCTSDDDDIDCDTILEQLPDLESTISGSGLLVQSDMGPAVLTAAHVCEREAPDVYEYAGVKISILSALRINVTSPIKGSFSASTIRVDEEHDLCLLKPEKIFTYPVKISRKEPSIGDRVYSIAAPYGISGHNLALVFNGYYSGTQDNVTFYTIPTKPGSSGSAVLNESWEVIGIIHGAFRSIENVGVGTGLKDIRNFLFTPVDVDVQIPSLPPLPTKISPIFE